MSTEQQFNNQKWWFESDSLSSMMTVLSTSPGKISKLIDRHFFVSKPFENEGPTSMAGRKVYRDIWVQGARGIVAFVGYNDHQGWFVNVEYQGPIAPEFLEIDEFDQDIPVREFLVHTMPLEDLDTGPSTISMFKAANDAQY